MITDGDAITNFKNKNGPIPDEALCTAALMNLLDKYL